MHRVIFFAVLKRSGINLINEENLIFFSFIFAMYAFVHLRNRANPFLESYISEFVLIGY